jgi:hypothetical protein
MTMAEKEKVTIRVKPSEQAEEMRRRANNGWKFVEAYGCHKTVYATL